MAAGRCVENFQCQELARLLHKIIPRASSVSLKALPPSSTISVLSSSSRSAQHCHNFIVCHLLSTMDNIHRYYGPPATETQFSKTVRFRAVNPRTNSAADASRKVSATRPPASISRTLKDGESPNAVAASQKENTALQLQT